MRRAWITPLIGVLALAALAFGDDDHGFEMLVRSIQGDFHVNVVATMLQRDRRGSHIFQRIQVMRSQGGKQHWAVIEPLSRAGIESVDNGKRWLTYIRDQNLLIDQDSPSHENADLKQRIRWAKRNYRFKTEPHDDVAGRPVLCVTAWPRHEELDGRRYCLDAQTAYPLRMETLSPDGDVSLVYDTKDVQYKVSLMPEAFDIHPSPGFSTIKYDRPRSLSPHEAERKFGFAPLIPGRLPLGFQVQDIQFSGSAEWRSMVVRLSDGLIHVNVYEWLPDNKPKKPMGDSTAGECRGVKLLLVSDNLGPDLRQELMDAFTQED